jgi:two-component sensor histidine kinase
LESGRLGCKFPNAIKTTVQFGLAFAGQGKGGRSQCPLDIKMMSWLLQVEQFMPHGMCLLWRPALIALHVASDGLIALAYFAIPVGIAYFLRRRPELNVQHKALSGLFALFITACGLTHVMSIVVLWLPYYDAEGALKAITALLSVATALALPFLIPQLLRIPSPRALAVEIAAHQSTLADLRAAREQLADRVVLAEGDLKETTRRFESALKGSSVTVFEQDEDLKYTWVYNPQMNLDPQALIGKSEDDLFAPDSVVSLYSLKRRALDSNSAQRAEVQVTMDRNSMWFDIQVEPVTLRNGRRGLVATASDITPLKRHQDNLHVVMRELNHRSKNLLTIVLSIVRQTVRVYTQPEQFTARLQERLASLANAHDVLAHRNWSDADLKAVVEGQLRHQLQTYGDRMTIGGDPCLLPPEAAQYIAMAIHELGSNALKYGALASDGGDIALSWTVDDTAKDPLLSMLWVETVVGGVPAPTREGFGTKILKVLTPACLGGQAELEFTDRGLRWSLVGRLQSPSPAPMPL